MMPWSRCNCWSRRESGRAITVTSWPARASRYANVLPILPAADEGYRQRRFGCESRVFHDDFTFDSFSSGEGWLSVDDVADPVQLITRISNSKNPAPCPGISITCKGSQFRGVSSNQLKHYRV